MRDRNTQDAINQARLLARHGDRCVNDVETDIRLLGCMFGFKGRACDDQRLIVRHPDRDRYPRPAPACGACLRRLEDMLADDGKALEAQHRIEMVLLEVYVRADREGWLGWQFPPRAGLKFGAKIHREAQKPELPVKPVQAEPKPEIEAETQKISSGLSYRDVIDRVLTAGGWPGDGLALGLPAALRVPPPPRQRSAVTFWCHACDLPDCEHMPDPLKMAGQANPARSAFRPREIGCAACHHTGWQHAQNGGATPCRCREGIV